MSGLPSTVTVVPLCVQCEQSCHNILMSIDIVAVQHKIGSTMPCVAVYSCLCSSTWMSAPTQVPACNLQGWLTLSGMQSYGCESACAPSDSDPSLLAWRWREGEDGVCIPRGIP